MFSANNSSIEALSRMRSPKKPAFIISSRKQSIVFLKNDPSSL
jgi:hypothetical protein